MVQCAQCVDCAEVAAGVVHVGPAPARGLLPRQAGRVRQAGQRLRYRPHRLIVAVAARVSKARHGQVDDVRPQLLHVLVAEPPSVEHSVGEVLDHDVGHGDKPPDQVLSAGRAGVERYAELVGVGVAEVAGGVERRLEAGHRLPTNAAGVGALGPLDLDNLRAKRAQPPVAPRACSNPREVQDADAVQRSGRGRHPGFGLQHSSHLLLRCSMSGIDWRLSLADSSPCDRPAAEEEVVPVAALASAAMLPDSQTTPLWWPPALPAAAPESPPDPSGGLALEALGCRD